MSSYTHTFTHTRTQTHTHTHTHTRTRAHTHTQTTYPTVRAGKSSVINGLKAAAARTKLLGGHDAYHKQAKTGPLPGVTRMLGSFQV
jgi:hypothetical protein